MTARRTAFIFTIERKLKPGWIIGKDLDGLVCCYWNQQVWGWSGIQGRQGYAVVDAGLLGGKYNMTTFIPFALCYGHKEGRYALDWTRPGALKNCQKCILATLD